MNKEQRDRARAMLVIQPVMNDDDGDAIVTALELLTDEAEADRTLGAKVRSAVLGLSPDEIEDLPTIDVGSSGVESVASGDQLAILQKIADALREEGGR